jgi:hypothetical protein
MKMNYIIPYRERFTVIKNCVSHRSLFNVDNLGIVVYHQKDVLPTENEIRNHLVGLTHTKTILIQADSLKAALEKFYSFKELKIGFKHKAWELADSKDIPIIEYSPCFHMKFKRGSGNLYCQYYAEEGKFDHMVCIIDGLDEPPTKCPILINQTRDREILQQIGGIWVQQYSSVCTSQSIGINGLKLRKISTQ